MRSAAQPRLSVIVPLYNEVEVVRELVARCIAACTAAEPSFELVLVDDASQDGTGQALAQLAASPSLGRWVRVVTLARNQGQYRATLAGLSEAQGEWLAVLDGDLQDPPEVLANLVAAGQADSSLDVVLAVKASRAERPAFRACRAVYAGLQRLACGKGLPSNAGSYCLMTRATRNRLLSVDVARANLAAVLQSLRPRWAAISYAKAARPNGSSRVGPLGLLAEAVGSWRVTGALRRLLSAGAMGGLCAGGAIAGQIQGTPASLTDEPAAALACAALLTSSVTSAIGALWLSRSGSVVG